MYLIKYLLNYEYQWCAVLISWKCSLYWWIVGVVFGLNRIKTNQSSSISSIGAVRSCLRKFGSQFNSFCTVVTRFGCVLKEPCQLSFVDQFGSISLSVSLISLTNSVQLVHLSSTVSKIVIHVVEWEKIFKKCEVQAFWGYISTMGSGIR